MESATDQIAQVALTGLAVGSIYALIALGFSIIYRTTDIINFAQGEFVMLGGLLTATFSQSLGWPMPAAVTGAVLVVGLVGAIVQLAALRPARGSSVTTLIIITIGVGIVIRTVAGMVWGRDPVPVDSFSDADALAVGGARLDAQYAWVAGLSVASLVLVGVFFRKTLIGKRMMACAINRRGARIVGIDPSRAALMAFTISAALAGLAGSAMAPVYYAGYDRGTMMGLKGFCALVLGGMNSATGAVVGGLAIGLLEHVGAYWASAYKDVFAFAALLLVLYCRPRGLLGGRD